MLLAGGFLIGSGSRAPWAQLQFPGGSTATLTLDPKASGALVVLGVLVLGTGVLRILRGYRKDAVIHTFAAVFLLLTLVLGVAVVGFFLNDHDLSVLAIGSWTKLQPQPALYVSLGGWGLAVLSGIA
jgi:hypothetical protein